MYRSEGPDAGQALRLMRLRGPLVAAAS